MGTNWTKEQNEVLETTDRNLLVSAAAGAGKTAVLVERIIRMITDDTNPVDIDRFVIMTFTRAAAAQMRTKLTEALEKRIEQNPLDKNLMRQYRLIPNATISTIDSFCISLVRDYFHELDIDPTFRVADETELGLLKADCMEKVLEAEYAEGEEDFIKLAESYSDSKSDKVLEEVIFSLAGKALSQPWPIDWLESLSAVYHIEEKKTFLESPTAVSIVKYAQGEALLMLNKLEFADKISKMEGGPAFYEELLGYLIQLVKGIISAEDYEQISKLLGGYVKTRLPGKKCDDPDLKERAKNIIESVRKSIELLKKKYFFSEVDEIIELIRKAEPVVNGLVKVTVRYLNEFEQLKKEKNVIDFADSEHFALRILLKKEDGGYVRSAAAKELQSRYSEIIIDEYQDSNTIQERIAEAIAGKADERPYIFTVGDVKQSIYKFRNACPELFVSKQEKYGRGEDGKLIVLDRNFRSRAEVLEASNALFKLMMIEEVGGISYDDTCSLKCGIEENPVIDARYRTELQIADQFSEENENKSEEKDTKTADGTEDGGKDPETEDEDNEEAEDALVFEARAVARRIHRLVKEEKLPIRDRRNEENILRPAGYGDVVILLRSMKGLSDVYAKVLESEGIPCITDSRNGFFKTPEVTLVTYYLALLDNPRQDIPLTAVLHSVLCGLTVEEMAKIRIEASPTPTFWDAVNIYRSKYIEATVAGQTVAVGRSVTENIAENVIRQKLEIFFEIFDGLREVKNDVSVVELINLFYEKTYYYSYVAAMPDGATGKANLEMLLGYAADYENTGYSGLFSFIRYLNQLKSHDLDYGEAGSEQAANAVHIMSIHQSKGLEFPVVILGNLGKGFNDQDSKAKLIIHSDYGIGMKYVDLEKRVKYPSLYESFIKLKMNEELVAEELRLLYVAMTRAKDKLIMAGTVKKKIASKLYGTDWKNYQNEKISYNELLELRSYMLMTYPAACRNPELFDILYDYGEGAVPKEGSAGTFGDDIPDNENGTNEEDQRTEEKSFAPEDFVRRLEECRNKVYSYKNEEEVPVKLSVSDLKLQSMMDEFGEEIFEETKPYETGGKKTVPDFMREKENAGSGNGYGTLVHKCMCFLDLSIADRKEMEEFIGSMVRDGRITPEESHKLNSAKFLEFLKTEAAQRMRQSEIHGGLFREQQFMLGLKASEVRPEFEGNDTMIPIQGVIDVMFVEDDGLIILDYKTDHVEADTGEEELIKRYKTQLDYYAKAAEQLLRLPVREKLLYSFALGKVIPV